MLNSRSNYTDMNDDVFKLIHPFGTKVSVLRILTKNSSHSRFVLKTLSFSKKH